MYLSAEKFPTEIAITRHLEAFVLKLNCENPNLAILEPTFNAILDGFIEEERLLEIKQQRPGYRCDAEEALSYSTAVS
jgi:integrase